MGAKFEKIGVLWPGRSAGTIASGFLSFPRTKLAVKENENPKGNNSPKYFIFAIYDDESQGGSGGGGGGGFQGGGGQPPPQGQGGGGGGQPPPQGGGWA